MFNLICLRVKVRFGEHTISNSGPDCPSRNSNHGCNIGVQDMEVERIISHPSYNSKTYQNDIAILKLKENVAGNGRYLSNIFIVELKMIIKPKTYCK